MFLALYQSRSDNLLSNTTKPSATHQRGLKRAAPNLRFLSRKLWFSLGTAAKDFGVHHPRSIALGTIVALVLSLGQVRAEVPTADDPSKAKVSSFSIEKNVVFAEVDGVQLLCDVYAPDASTSESTSGASANGALANSQLAPSTPPKAINRPAVVVVHGGAWRSGDKLAISPYARAFAQAGLVAVSINYRLAPDYHFPCQVDDVRLALIWLAQHAEKYQIDQQNIGLMGYSAGAHLSCLLGTLVDASWDTLRETTAWPKDDPRWEMLPKVRAVVGGGTPCEFRGLPPQTELFTYFLGGTPEQFPEKYIAASPTFHASPGDAPMLLVHGTRDLLVPLKSSQLLRDALTTAGVACELLALEGPGHMLTFLHPETKSASVRFLCERLGMPHENTAKPEE